MDISVSRLNKRMAMQVPAEFPLGLVFVVGKVRNLHEVDEEGGPPFFYLAENNHTLRCHLSEQAFQKYPVNEGDMIRAGGHLVFDVKQADYYLLAKDIELLPERRPSHTTLAPILADVKKRAESAHLVPAVLPDWVQRIAPPELQDLAEAGPDRITNGNGRLSELPTIETAEPSVTTTSTELETATNGVQHYPGGLTDELIAFLSEAMDSAEEVELTQQMVNGLAPETKPDTPPSQTETAPRMSRPSPAPAKTETRIPWIVVFFSMVMLMVFIALILVLILNAAI